MEKKGKKKEKEETKREGTGDNRTISVDSIIVSFHVSYILSSRRDYSWQKFCAIIFCFCTIGG